MGPSVGSETKGTTKMEQQLTTEPRTAAAAPPTCDDGGCSSGAVFSYTWDWGQHGVCCALHQHLHQQKSETLQRKVNFAPLLPPGPVPLTRDERTKLKAEVYAVEAEIEDHKARCSELYRENTALTRQVQASTTRLRETELQLSEATKVVDELRWKLEKRDAEQATLVDEVTRLRTLSKYPPLQAEAAEATTVVDGPTSSSAAAVSDEQAKFDAAQRLHEAGGQSTSSTHGLTGAGGAAPTTTQKGSKPKT
jgi:hypothetical protein